MNPKSLLISIIAATVICGVTFAETTSVPDIKQALAKARSEKKMLFLQYGREACENCQALKAMVKSGKVRLSTQKFVYADVNCDDAETKKVFGSKFKVSGRTLPFVIVASPDGKQLAARSGYGTDADFNKLIKEAEKVLKK